MVETSISQPIIGSQGFQERPFESLKTQQQEFIQPQQQFQQQPSSMLMQQNIPQPPPLNRYNDFLLRYDKMEVDSSRIIKEKPVLDRVEKIQRTDIHKKVHIQEKRIQDIVEVREMPVQKRFLHPVQQLNINDESIYEVEGKDAAEHEIERMLQQLRAQDMNHQVEVKQTNDVFVHEYEPTRQVERELVKHYVITKPIITEIHEQPIEEIHEQRIERVIYEKPVLRVIRSDELRNEVEQVQRGADFSHLKNLQPTNLSSGTSSGIQYSSGQNLQQQSTTGSLLSGSQQPLLQSSTALPQQSFGNVTGTSRESMTYSPVVSDKLPYQQETEFKKTSTVPKVGFGEQVNTEFDKKRLGERTL